MKRERSVNPKQGARLREVMRDNKLSQSKLGESIWCTQQAISRYVTCQRRLPPYHAEIIGRKYGVRPEWLLCIDDWKMDDDEHRAAVIDRTWDADDKAKELLGAFGFYFERGGDVRKVRKTFFSEDGEALTVDVEDRNDRNAYRILSNGNEVGRCSLNDHDSLIDSIEDFAENAIRDLLNRREQNNG